MNSIFIFISQVPNSKGLIQILDFVLGVKYITFKEFLKKS